MTISEKTPAGNAYNYLDKSAQCFGSLQVAMICDEMADLSVESVYLIQSYFERKSYIDPLIFAKTWSTMNESQSGQDRSRKTRLYI